MSFKGMTVTVFVLLVTAAAAAWALTRHVTISIDTSIRYQTISGWEVTADLPDFPTRSESFLGYDLLLSELVDRGGINRIRLEVRAGAETSSGQPERFITGRIPYEVYSETYYIPKNDNDDPGVIDWAGFDFSELDHHVENTVLPLRDRLRSRGEDLIINLCYVAFISGDHLHRNPSEYAEFALAVFQHLDRKYGFVPDLWEVALEPDLLDDSWTGEELGRIIVETAGRLQDAGYRPGFVAPSVTDMSNAVPYTEEIVAVEGAREHIAELSFHPYKGRTRSHLIEIAEKAQELGLRTSQLEWWFGNATHEVLHEDLKLANVSAWQGRVVRTFFQPVTEGGRIRFEYYPDTLFTSAYFRNIRSEAVRIDATSNNMILDPVAFTNTDGTTTVLVLSHLPTTAEITGLPPGTYRASLITTDDTLHMLSGVTVLEGRAMEVPVPSAGLLLVTSRPPEGP